MYVGFCAVLNASLLILPPTSTLTSTLAGCVTAGNVLEEATVSVRFMIQTVPASTCRKTLLSAIENTIGRRTAGRGRTRVPAAPVDQPRTLTSNPKPFLEAGTRGKEPERSAASPASL